jgi:hypothetical protein
MRGFESKWCHPYDGYDLIRRSMPETAEQIPTAVRAQQKVDWASRALAAAATDLERLNAEAAAIVSQEARLIANLATALGEPVRRRDGEHR